MQNKTNFEKLLDGIKTSGTSPDDKITELNKLIGGLNQLEQGEEICRASELGTVIAEKANQFEMAAQFCLMRAKAEIAQAALLIKEMKDLTMALEWFDFGLDTDKKRYKELDIKLKTTWRNTQAMINAGYSMLNKKPYVGAVAYCHRTAGEIYGTHYLQLKLHYFITGRPWRARIGNLAIARWLDLDDLFIMSKKSREHLRTIKKDCLTSIHKAIPLFKQEKAYAYVVESYFDLALEHHSFNDPVRSKFYLWWGRFLMICHKFNEPRLQISFDSLKEFPLIGSNRA